MSLKIGIDNFISLTEPEKTQFPYFSKTLQI